MSVLYLLSPVDAFTWFNKHDESGVFTYTNQTAVISVNQLQSFPDDVIIACYGSNFTSNTGPIACKNMNSVGLLYLDFGIFPILINCNLT